MPKKCREGQAAIWSRETFESVLTQLPMPHKIIFAICGYTGCRISEARQLCAGDIGKADIHFRRAIVKGKDHSRSVPICHRLGELLTEADLPTSGYLFPGRHRGQPITRVACDQALRRACAELGLEGYSTHSCRRSWATRLDKAGVRLKAIAALGGWASLENLGRYLDVDEGELRAAVEV
jgi:integrase/recombinase XerD